jgi:predicted ATPase
MGSLLERDSELARLHGWLIEAVAGHGRTVFVGGEAGIGKSALVGELARSAPADVRTAVGRCDALRTPRVLGPFLRGGIGARSRHGGGP